MTGGPIHCRPDVDRDDFPAYPADRGSRFDHREEHLPDVLFEAVNSSQLINNGLAQDFANHLDKFQPGRESDAWPKLLTLASTPR